MIEDKIKNKLAEILKEMGIENPIASLEHPDDISHGDYSTNVALFYAKELKKSPRVLAETLRLSLEKEFAQGEIGISKVEVAGAGFINFYLTQDFFAESVEEINKNGENFGKNEKLAGKKVMVEYTDPNPFKEFHIGHLMSNTIGESLSRLIEFQGAEVKRACYQGDVGLHVAKAIWGALKETPQDIAGWGRAYASVAKVYQESAEAKKEIEEINKKIFEKSDKKINELYEKGKAVSLEHFEALYRRLGTKFNHYFFESETGEFGKKLVEEFLGRGVFEKSDGAFVFRGDKHGLHTRVFVNSLGLPTYEAKELGLAKIKYDAYPYDLSLIVTANEVNEYFKVVLAAMREVFPLLAAKTKHLSHGVLRLPSGKMSSREGTVVTAESLLSAVEAMVHKKLEERELETTEKNKIAEMVAVGAVKYSILRQAIGGDIIFDFEKSISFEGDSGPYLQYSYVRARSVLAKADKEGGKASRLKAATPDEVTLLERLLYRFPEVVERAGEEYAPHLITTYLTELAGAFNSFYASTKIIGSADERYYLALTSAFAAVMKNGLWLLGIQAPERM